MRWQGPKQYKESRLSTLGKTEQATRLAGAGAVFFFFHRLADADRVAAELGRVAHGRFGAEHDVHHAGSDGAVGQADAGRKVPQVVAHADFALANLGAKPLRHGDRVRRVGGRQNQRSEERRVGKECRSRWAAEYEKKKKRHE